MSTEPLPGPGPEPDDDLPRYRWVPPLMIGLSLGVLAGGAAIFIVMSLANRPRTTELAAERFSVQGVLNNTPGGESIAAASDATDYLGATGRRVNTGSAVHRRITLSGDVGKSTDVSNLGNTLKAQVDAELARHGASSWGGGSSSSSGPNEFSTKWNSSFHTRDGRRGCVDGVIDIRHGRLEATIILTEGR